MSLRPIIWLIVCYAGIVLWVAWARAEDDTQVLLARAAWAECGSRYPSCHAAAWHMADGRARLIRRPLDYTIREYFAAWDVRNRRRRPRLIKSLHPDGRQPDAWWPNARWERYRPIWLAIYERAGTFLAGGVPNPCNGQPLHTGGSMDHPPSGPLWRKLDCGETGTQSFWGLDR